MFKIPFLRKRKGFWRETKSELEPQEVMLDFLARKQVDEQGGEEKKLEVPLRWWKTGLMYAVFLLVVLVFAGRTMQLQVFATQELQELASQNTIRSTPIFAERGVIYDRSMRQLVFNRPSFDIVCDKRDLSQNLKEREQSLVRLAQLFGIPTQKMKKQFDASSNPQFLFADNLSHEQLIVAETRLKEFEGCHLQENTVREYEKDLGLAHLLGYTAKVSVEELKEFSDYGIADQIGKIGVERNYETFLRGKAGEILVEKDSTGTTIRPRGEISGAPGSSVVLALDVELQQIIEEELKAALSRLGAHKAAAVALDPRDGGALALVNIPSFDNNLFSGGITQEQYNEIVQDSNVPLFNRAVAGTYPTGSTIKPFVAVAALEEGIIDPAKSILTKGYIEVPNQYDPEIIYRFNDWKNHGWVNMRDALAVSSNVYFYTLGGGYEGQEGLGPSRLKQYLSLFGWGKKTGVDLVGEAEGLIPDPQWKQIVKKEPWTDGDTYNMSIGQGNLLATPLQVAASYVPIANGGIMYQPKIAQKIIKTSPVPGEEPEEVVVEPVIVWKNAVDPAHIQVVREGMRQAVTEGSSIVLNQLEVDVAAKTGSAQTGRRDANGNDYLYAWTSAFAPYENPEIVLTVMIEDVQEGGLLVLPIIKEVFSRYLDE